MCHAVMRAHEQHMISVKQVAITARHPLLLGIIVDGLHKSELVSSKKVGAWNEKLNI